MAALRERLGIGGVRDLIERRTADDELDVLYQVGALAMPDDALPNPVSD